MPECPTCGSPVLIGGDDEGTHYYVPAEPPGVVLSELDEITQIVDGMSAEHKNHPAGHDLAIVGSRLDGLRALLDRKGATE